ncbi:ABC transporter substrate-binding protein [Ktedonobacter racemifer]|uniref:Extracellular ligand-binding receptor n=1 Tax=Ktedonobacter racemifer DSM 44963 TaxID=485913 RepID=D6U5Y8_KTERA|nr:ABC transporter substrate-binding protein [Ktedonobacter racemifer]EFH80399.1 Extracellular ligand-binding receptor [Ktedonobacter racemifer DSM 44963]
MKNQSDGPILPLTKVIRFVITFTLFITLVYLLSFLHIIPDSWGNFLPNLATILAVPVGIIAILAALKNFEKALVQVMPRPTAWGPPKIPKINRKLWMLVGLVVAVALIVVGGYHYIWPAPQSTVPPLLFSYSTPDGPIGISDGSYVFDVKTRNNQGHHNGALKQQAANAFRSQNFDQARQLWGQAISGDDSDDAEVLIYQENQRIINSGSPYITFIAVTQLTGSHEEYGIGREDLQGYYVAQKEFNSQANPFRVRVLIANIGDQETYAQQVTDRILSSYQQDPTIKGVLGWPERTQRINSMLLTMCNKHIPIVTVSANDSRSSDGCNYNFSVAPTIDSQAATAVQYIKSVLKKKRVSIVYDPANEYSQSLYRSFIDDFRRDQPSDAAIVDRETYSIYSSNTLPGLLRATLRGKPDLIYFAGYPADLNAVIQSLPASGGVDVMAANIIYQAPHFPKAQPVEHVRVYFTAFAYPDQWAILHLAQPDFTQEYINAYDPQQFHRGAYGYERANDSVMIAYDALKSLMVVSKGFQDSRFPMDQLQRALFNSKYKGITGDIRYNQGSVDTKPVVVIQFTHGYNVFKGVDGCYDDNAQGGCFDVQNNGRP